jgi:adenylate cyclase
VSDEVERKFLVSAKPNWLGDYPATRIEQGYLAIAERAEVRLRRAGDELTLTVKRGHGEVREEVEISLDREDFNELWPLTDGLRLTKTRHMVPLEGELTAEVDVYAGRLEGLVTAEVEFETEAQSGSFQPPDWLGEELTEDARYSNQSLASTGPPMRHPAEHGKE